MKSFKRNEVIYLLYEVIAGAPSIMIPIGFVLGEFGEMGSLNLDSKLNLIVLTVFPFIFFTFPFFILFYEIKIEKAEKKKEYLKKLKREMKKNEIKNVAKEKKELLKI